MQAEWLTKLEFGTKVWIQDAGSAIFLRFLPHFRRNPVICLKWIEADAPIQETAVILAVKPELLVPVELAEKEPYTLRKIKESTHLISGRIIVIETIKFR